MGNGRKEKDGQKAIHVEAIWEGRDPRDGDSEKCFRVDLHGAASSSLVMPEPFTPPRLPPRRNQPERRGGRIWGSATYAQTTSIWQMYKHEPPDDQ